MKKFLESDWLRGVQFYSKLQCTYAVQINKTRAETGNESEIQHGVRQ